MDKQYVTAVGETVWRSAPTYRYARALYKQADVIVFDEATSALDNDAERIVMETIKNLGDELP